MISFSLLIEHYYAIIVGCSFSLADPPQKVLDNANIFLIFWAVHLWILLSDLS